MAAYILFKNITKEEIKLVIDFLNSVSKNSNYGPSIEDAIGVCTTTITNTYTYLSENMCTKENPYVSWVMSRKEYTNIKDFIEAVKEHVEEYNICYKQLHLDYENRTNNG